jgi:hypothetical protein
MKAHYRNEPHSPLMTMVSVFRVAFSIDEKLVSEQDSRGNVALHREKL